MPTTPIHPGPKRLDVLNTWHLSSNPWNSAITEYVLSTARSLAGRGHSVTMTVLDDSPAAARSKGYGLVCRSVPDFSPSSLFKLRKLAGEIRPDLIFTYGGRETSLMAALSALGLKAPIVRFYGYQARGHAAFDRWRWHLSHWPVKAVLTPSEGLAADLRRVAPGGVFAPIPLGCDEKRFVRVNQRRDLEQGRPEVMIFGRFDPVKDHGGAMAIFRAVLSAWPSGAPRPLMRIVGEPANVSESDLKAAAAAHGLALVEDVIIDVGRKADVAELLSGATVGMVPSNGSELICRVAEEFLLCGVPLLVSGVGSLDEVLYPGAGESYRGESGPAAAERLMRLLRIGFDERAATRQHRADEARRRYSLAAMGTALQALIDSLSLRPSP